MWMGCIALLGTKMYWSYTVIFKRCVVPNAERLQKSGGMIWKAFQPAQSVAGFFDQMLFGLERPCQEQSLNRQSLLHAQRKFTFRSVHQVLFNLLRL